jgi:glutamyl-tRNA synthetase
MPTVTRFAPSPTGYLHVGGARTALFDYLLARHAGGRFLLRIEDTDQARSTRQATEQLIDDLRWLGLHWDNAQLVYQSQRLNVYDAIIDELIRGGRAYKAYETSQELDAMRAAAEKQKRAFIYRRPELSDEQVRRYETEGRPHVVRFAMPVRDCRFDDLVLGPGQGVPATQVQDFVIRKSDGMPTYHFAVVVDDAEMGVSHVLRGQEHLLNTVNHIALQEALGYPRPAYAHLPIILNVDGSKMGKRDRDRTIRQRAQVWMNSAQTDLDGLAAAAGLAFERVRGWIADAGVQLDFSEQSAVMNAIGMRVTELPEVFVHDFRRNGYLPEVLLNFLALLGWNPGGDRERMSMDEMARLFMLDNVGRSNAKFDRAKLLAFNTETCAAAPTDRLVAAMRDFLQANPESPVNRASDAELARLIELKRGFHILADVEQQCRFLFVADEQITYEAAAVDKILRKQNNQGATTLRDVWAVLDATADWTAAALESAVKQFADHRQLGLGKVAQPIRVAITGSTVSPPIFQSLELLGRQRTLARIQRCLAVASGAQSPA